MFRKRFTGFFVFQGSENRRWWRIFLRRGWRHVRLLIPIYDPYPSLTAKEYTLVIEQWTDHLRADVVFKPARALAMDMLRDGATCVVAYPVMQSFTNKYRFMGLITCVSISKAFTSINSWIIFTPYHLARWMLRNGGELITLPSETQRNDSVIQQAKG